jgi:hypothetical protein
MTRFSRVAAARLEAADEMLLASGWTRDDIGWLAPEDFRSALADHLGHGHLTRSQAVAAQVQFDEALTQKMPKTHGAAS